MIFQTHIGVVAKNIFHPPRRLAGLVRSGQIITGEPVEQSVDFYR